MKGIIIILILAFSLQSKAQNECGQLSTKEAVYSTWKAIDTLGKFSDEIGWVESSWKPVAPSESILAIYMKPTGCPVRPPIVESQQRIGKKSGILQERTRITEFYYIPNPKTQFDLIIETVK